MDHLLTVMRNPAERASGFVALGEMAGAVGKELVPYLPVITSLIKDAVSDLCPSELSEVEGHDDDSETFILFLLN